MSKKDVNNRYREEEKDDVNESSENVNEEVKEEKNVDVEELLKQIKELKNEVLLAKANEVNTQKRLEADKELFKKYANQSLLEKFVDQIDLFDSVVNMKTDDPVLKNFLIGFEMINNKFPGEESEDFTLINMKNYRL